MELVRDSALEQVPADATPEAKQAASDAVRNTLYAMMQLLDGVSRAELDEEHRVEYVLQARIRGAHDTFEESFELAPDGDGLCMGFHSWYEGKFWGS